MRHKCKAFGEPLLYRTLSTLRTATCLWAQNATLRPLRGCAEIRETVSGVSPVIMLDFFLILNSPSIGTGKAGGQVDLILGVSVCLFSWKMQWQSEETRD